MDQSNKHRFINFRPKHDFLVGIDSDGCVFNSMEIKHKECFIPHIINFWNLQAISEFVREVAEFVNLYSQWRGTNRFPALVKTFDLLRERSEVRRSKVPIPELTKLRSFIDSGAPLGNTALAKTIAESGDHELEQILAWSVAVNVTVADVGKNVSAFPLVKESLAKLSSIADIIVVSETPVETLVREWNERGIAQYVDIIAGQEVGDKKAQLCLAIGDKYQKNHVMMIGDSPGDIRAAHSNEALFYPIVPGQEEISWSKFYSEIIDLFMTGMYTKVLEAKLIAGFQSLLPSEPPWI